MFSARQLSDDQKAALHRWADEGATMSDFQRRLKEEFGVSITYMDTRFLILDLGITLKEEAKAEEKKPEDEIKEAPVPTGKVTVSVDQLTLPGSLISGQVTFSDGEKGVWMIDQSGRPGLDPDTPGYRPTPEDIADFQVQLRELLRKQGY